MTTKNTESTEKPASPPLAAPTGSARLVEAERAIKAALTWFYGGMALTSNEVVEILEHALKKEVGK